MRYNVYKDKNLIHFPIGKCANVSQLWMAYEPENWDTFNDNNGGKRINLPEKDFERHVLDLNKTPEFNQELIKRQYPNYFISVFIRDPIKRFASGIAQDYDNLTIELENHELILKHPNYISDFDKRFAEFTKDPSLQNLNILFKYKDARYSRHLAPQGVNTDYDNITKIGFDHLPENVEYFNVDQNLTQNYRHWLFENKLTKYQNTPKHGYIWHRNDASKIGRKKEIQDVVFKYIANSNTLLNWIYEYYAIDFEMYERLKPRCYSHKKTAP